MGIGVCGRAYNILSRVGQFHLNTGINNSRKGHSSNSDDGQEFCMQAVPTGEGAGMTREDEE